MAVVRPELTLCVKCGAKERPGLETQGCMMDTQIDLKDFYRSLNTEAPESKYNPYLL
jgi:hypothetical protein